MNLLREGLLDGVVFAGRSGVTARLEALGARAGDEPSVLVWDASAAPESADDVRAALDRGWEFIHAHTQGSLLDRGGLILLIAPRAGDAHAEAARAGLENLARTLSIEWARFGVRTVAVLAGGEPEAIAELCAYLASPAGAYFSGCAFTFAG